MGSPYSSGKSVNRIIKCCKSELDQTGFCNLASCVADQLQLFASTKKGWQRRLNELREETECILSEEKAGRQTWLRDLRGAVTEQWEVSSPSSRE